MQETFIRDERPGDEPAIEELTRAAFLDHPHSGGTEHLIVNALRRSGALTISLVAERAGQVAGHVAFSPVSISGASSGWFGLGPVSVLPAMQNLGIGQALVRAGLERLRTMGARGCVVLGEPSYYSRFGFIHVPDLVLPDVPPEYFQCLAFGTTVARGQVSYHPSFSVQE
jgi:putative acetyltransferase